MKLFTKEVDKQLFAQYPKGSSLENQMVVAKIFNPYGRGVWYLLNSDPEDPDYIWAIVDLFEPEMGSVSRSELQTVKVPPFGLGLERDIYFTPKPAKEVFEGILSGKRYAAGGMTPGRYYKDNSGNELRYVGESQGKLLFKDGEKIVYKSEEDFEDRPKETKLFGFFEKGGEIAQENNEMLQSNIVELKHHADELDKIVTNKTEVEPWVIAKTERASTDLSDVTHYLDGEKKKGLKMPFEKGGYMARGGGFNQYGEPYGFGEETDSVYEIHHKPEMNPNNPYLIWDKIDGVYIAEFPNREKALHFIDYKKYGYKNGGYMARGGKISYEGKEGKIVSKKGDMYFVEIEKYHPNGDTLRTVLREGEFKKMADGGMLPNGKYKYEKGDEGMFQGDEVRVVKYYNGDRTYEYNIIDEDGKVKTHGVAKAEKFENQFRYFPKMARGGEITPYIVWVSKDGEKRELFGEFKSKRAADMKMNKLWESGEYKQIGNKPFSMYQKEGFYAHGGETKGKKYKVNVYYGGEMEDEEFYTNSLDEAKRVSQGGEHSEIYDNHKKEFVEIEYAKGGSTKRNVKLTLSDKDSYDYTYKQDGATASITFGFGKEPFQYEVKKISKSLEPLKQDILDTFTIQGIKQHEYKGGFSEAIKHLDTSILYGDKQFAKGGDIYDDMDEDIEVANKKATYLFEVLKGSGYKPYNLEKANYDADASIEISKKTQVSVSLDGEIAVVTEEGDGKFRFIDAGTSISSMLQTLKGLDKKYLEKGGYMAKGGTTESYEVELSAESNPDYDKSSYEGSVNIKSHKVKAKSIEEAREIVVAFIMENDLGSGNWSGGNVYKNGKKIGHVSYNGRYWDDTKMAKGGKLVGKQKNLDVNKNGKLDAEDFKMLRGEKMEEGGKLTPAQIKARSYRVVSPSGTREKKKLDKAFIKEEIKKIPKNEMKAIKAYMDNEDLLYNDYMAMGGKVKFEDKVKAIKESLLKRKKVSPKVQKDYGKTYSPKEAEESAKRIAASQRMKYELKKKFKKGGRTIAQTPAPKKDRVFGSSKNKPGSASSKKAASKIELNESIVKTLTEKAKAYNEKHSSKVSTSTLKAVMRRGMGAYSTSHRPTITGGAPNSRQAWGFARVNKFLKKKGGAQVKAAYVQDDDLL